MKASGFARRNAVTTIKKTAATNIKYVEIRFLEKKPNLSETIKA